MDWQDLLKELVETVQNIAPRVWEIAIRQVYVGMIGWILFLLVALGGLILAIWIFRSMLGSYRKEVEAYKAKEQYSDPDPSWIVLGTFFVLLAMAITSLPIYEILARLINPHWYAIELLVNYVK
jgi:hypothetical protein